MFWEKMNLKNKHLEILMHTAQIHNERKKIVKGS